MTPEHRAHIEHPSGRSRVNTSLCVVDVSAVHGANGPEPVARNELGEWVWHVVPAWGRSGVVLRTRRRTSEGGLRRARTRCARVGQIWVGGSGPHGSAWLQLGRCVSVRPPPDNCACTRAAARVVGGPKSVTRNGLGEWVCHSRVRVDHGGPKSRVDR